MRRIRRPSHATVVAYLALFVALGGTAMASVIITNNNQVDRGTISGHRPPSGKHPNIIGGSISGKDIADRSGVDTCKTPLVGKFGPICAGSDAVVRNWSDAVNYCAGFGLRLPSASEAVALAKNSDVPGVTKRGSPPSAQFWTDELVGNSSTALTVNEAGGLNAFLTSATTATVCVTDPSA